VTSSKATSVAVGLIMISSFRLSGRDLLIAPAVG
jgi:hypothetical protein